VQRDELDSECLEFTQGVYELAQTSGESVVSKDEYSIEQSSAACGEQLVQLRASFLGAAHADIREFCADVPSSAPAVFAKLAKLHGRILADVRANANVQRHSHRRYLRGNGSATIRAGPLLEDSGGKAADRAHPGFGQEASKYAGALNMNTRRVLGENSRVTPRRVATTSRDSQMR
jgi:hypothetical protein